MHRHYLYELPQLGSQYGQAYLIRDLLCRSGGFYVDVGARCGVAISNTRPLEQHGWKGICVEPHPDLFEKLTASRQCVCKNFAASDKPGSLDFVRMLEEPLGNSGLLATFPNPKRLENMAHEIISVPCRTVTSILDECEAPLEIQYLDVDVERHEMEVVRGIDFDKYSFHFIGLECQPDSDKFDEMSDYLAQKGYRAFAQIGSDIFFTSFLGK